MGIAQALIDNGSSVNLISETLVSRLGVKVQPMPNSGNAVLQGANGASMSLRGFVPDIVCQGPEGYETTIRNVLVVGKLIHEVILGIPWLQAVNPSIDWATRKITIPGPSHSYTFSWSEFPPRQSSIQLLSYKQARRHLRRSGNCLIGLLKATTQTTMSVNSVDYHKSTDGCVEQCRNELLL